MLNMVPGSAAGISSSAAHSASSLAPATRSTQKGRISLRWSCVNCGGGDCSPGSEWLAGPMVCRRPPCAALVPGSRPGPGSPASVYTSVGDSEGSAAPQLWRSVSKKFP